MVVGNNSEKDLSRMLWEAGCFKVGQFTLKSGVSSNYYIDMRESTLHVELYKSIILAMVPKLRSLGYQSSDIAVVGVPYGVVPIASILAWELEAPYYPVRKEVKEYGNKADSGLLKDNKYILVEDVMSTGSSIIETIKKLEGRNVTDVFVIVDREMGGEKNLAAAYPNVRLHSLLTARGLLEQYKEHHPGCDI